MTTPPLANPGVRLPPPILFLGGLLLSALLDRLFPLPLHEGGRGLVAGGATLIVIGLALMIWAISIFSRAGTEVLPTRPATTLVLEGPYRRTRNPMYVGFTLVYVGATLLMASIWSLILLPVIIVTLIRKVIHREERYLSSAFGAEYEAYRSRVRRWI